MVTSYTNPVSLLSNHANISKTPPVRFRLPSSAEARREDICHLSNLSH